MSLPRRLLAAVLALSLLGAACGGTDTTTGDDTAGSDTAAGVRLVTPEQGADLQGNPPADLVILDVRTADEFAAGHLDGAVMLDFYRADFADQLALLDPDVPYLLYCRSGNRSGQTAAMMQELGFSDVADVDGGIVAWADAGLPLVAG